MITSQQIKEAAKQMGADIVGIGSIDRWSTAPIQMDPKQIMPRAKSIIALGFRFAALRRVLIFQTTRQWATVELPIFICL